jgi:hypothetical protein
MLAVFNDMPSQGSTTAPFVTLNSSSFKGSGGRASAEVTIPPSFLEEWNHNSYGGMAAHVEVQACSLVGCGEKASLDFEHSSPKHGIRVTWGMAGELTAL